MALSADDRIALIRVKLERAKKHLRDLEEELIPLQGKYHDPFEVREDPATGTPSQILTDVPIYTFEVLSIAGDTIHNLRSALDHLAYQLCIAGSNATPSKWTKFPIAKDYKTYESEKGRCLEGTRAEAISAIDALRPYKGGDDILWRVHELNNIDKHRYILTVGNDAVFRAAWYSNDPEGGFLFRPRGVKAGAPNFQGVFDSSSDNYLSFDLGTAVDQAQVESSDTLLPSLKNWVKHIETVILSFRRHLSSE